MADVIHATLIGDLVGSRRASSRIDLQRSLRRALDRVNSFLQPAQALEPTVGDEFQGAFRDLGSAVDASLLLRLYLLEEGEIDARFGLGFGEVTVFENRTPISQDGPGWWSARTAIERAAELGRVRRTEFVRTYLECSAGDALSRGEVGVLNAYFMCRDALVGQMKPRGHRLLLGSLLGASQERLAEGEGISQSAVSQHLASSGAHAIKAARLELESRLP